MAPFDDLYRDSLLAKDWERDMQTLIDGGEGLFDHVALWSRTLRGMKVDPLMYRMAMLNLMEGKRQPVTDHYQKNAREDRVHRLVCGQPVETQRSVPWYDDVSRQSYGPVPTPVSFVGPFLDDLEKAGYARDDVTLEEVGCGTGLFTSAAGLMKKTRMKIRALDWNAVAIEVARRTAASFGLSDLSFEAGRAQQMDLSKGDIYYLHSPFMSGTDMERRFCGALVREAQTRPLVVATLYEVTEAFRGRLPHLNASDGYDGVALFGSRHSSASNNVHPALSGAADGMGEKTEA